MPIWRLERCRECDRDTTLFIVCPGLITHRIDAHHYCREFCEAVRRCPIMRSREYLLAILVNGGRQLSRFGSVAKVGHDQCDPGGEDSNCVRGKSWATANQMSVRMAW